MEIMTVAGFVLLPVVVLLAFSAQSCDWLARALRSHAAGLCAYRATVRSEYKEEE